MFRNILKLTCFTDKPKKEKHCKIIPHLGTCDDGQYHNWEDGQYRDCPVNPHNNVGNKKEGCDPCPQGLMTDPVKHDCGKKFVY